MHRPFERPVILHCLYVGYAGIPAGRRNIHASLSSMMLIDGLPAPENQCDVGAWHCYMIHTSLWHPSLSRVLWKKNFVSTPAVQLGRHLCVVYACSKHWICCANVGIIPGQQLRLFCHYTVCCSIDVGFMVIQHRKTLLTFLTRCNLQSCVIRGRKEVVGTCRSS